MWALFVCALAAVPGRYDAAWAAALPPGQARLPAGTYQGPWTLGTGVHLIAARGATLEGGDPVLTIAGDGVRVSGLAVRATNVGISARRVKALDLVDLTVSGGRQSVYVAEADVRIAHTTLSQSEYGVLAWKARLELEDVTASAIRRTGFGLVRSTGTVQGCLLDGPFLEAAVSVIGSKGIALQHNHVRHAGAVGLKLLSSSGELAENDVSGARSDGRGLEGDDVYLFDSTVTSRGDRLDDAGGTGLTVLGGHAMVTACRIGGAAQAAVYAGERGRVDLTGCTVDRSPAGLIVEPGAAGQATRTKFLHIGPMGD